MNQNLIEILKKHAFHAGIPNYVPAPWEIAAMQEAVETERANCAQLCTTSYRTPDGWGITHADERCANLIKAQN